MGFKPKEIEADKGYGNINQIKEIQETSDTICYVPMGKFCFLLRKKHKVQIEVDLYTTVYNLKRLINIENMGNLHQKVRKYEWKIA